MRPKAPYAIGAPAAHDALWRELTVEEAEQRVIGGGESLLVLGAPGTGKTTFVQGACENLRSQGFRVDIISKTHHDNVTACMPTPPLIGPQIEHVVQVHIRQDG